LINEIIKINCNSTHPHNKSILSTIAIVYSGKYLIFEKGDKKNIIKYIIDFFEKNGYLKNEYYDKETFEYLKQIDELPENLINNDEYKILLGDQPTNLFPEGVFGLPCSGFIKLIKRNAYNGNIIIYY
jgi:hypothetical protein